MTVPLCEVCYSPIDSEDGLSYFCEADCGRSGFCSWCARPENHDCDADEAAHAEHLRHLAEHDRWAAMSDRERDDEIKRAMG